MGEAIGGSMCSHTPIKHAGTSKGGVTCDGGTCITWAQEDRHQLDGSIRACAEVKEGHESMKPDNKKEVNSHPTPIP